jgi:molybdopterin/thiamine biosynthesis adenylyltransferase
MNDGQLERYSRHLLLPQFDYQGQTALLESKVLVLGLGGLGSSAALYLASSGIGELHLLDPDTLELSNLQRQVIHKQEAIGVNKALSAKQTLSALNDSIKIVAHASCLSESLLAELISTMNVVLDCTDNSHSRRLHNQLCVQQKVPLISAAAIRFEGQLMVVDPSQENTPCYQCVYPNVDTTQMSCSELGIMAPVVGMMGVFQSLEAIKIISGVGAKSSGALHSFDGLSAQWRRFNVTKNEQCPVCGGA